MVNESRLPHPVLASNVHCGIWSAQNNCRSGSTTLGFIFSCKEQRFIRVSAIQCSPFNLLLRSYINNSCFVFHQRFQTPRNNKSTTYSIVLSSVSWCLEPLMKYSHSLLIYYFKPIPTCINKHLLASILAVTVGLPVVVGPFPCRMQSRSQLPFLDGLLLKLPNGKTLYLFWFTMASAWWMTNNINVQCRVIHQKTFKSC